MSSLKLGSSAKVIEEKQEDQLRQYLTFFSNDEQFSIAIEDVKEIVDYDNVTDIPLMPKFIKGVMNLRGEVLLVIDLASRLGKDATRSGKRNCVIVIEFKVGKEIRDIGVLVSSVNEVIEIGGDMIGEPPDFGASIRADFIAGVAEIGEKFVLILQIDRVLSAEDIEALIKAAQDVEASNE